MHPGSFSLAVYLPITGFRPLGGLAEAGENPGNSAF
jgi:hypothetical protein